MSRTSSQVREQAPTQTCHPLTLLFLQPARDQDLRRVLDTCKAIAHREGWFQVNLGLGDARVDVDDPRVTWDITFVGPTAYVVNPVTDKRPRASPYRNVTFNTLCIFPEGGYPTSTPLVLFSFPVYHPHIHRNGVVDPDLMRVLWKKACVAGFSVEPPPVVLAHLLLELLAYPSVPEPVVSRSTPSPADEAGCAAGVLREEGVENYEQRVREVILEARSMREERVEEAEPPAVVAMCRREEKKNTKTAEQRRQKGRRGSDDDECCDTVVVKSTLVQSVGLWQLVLHGRVRDVQRLLDSGVDANTMSGVPVRPLLSWAAMSQDHVAHQLAIMQLLVRADANVNQQGPFGRTPLMTAARAGFEKAVHLLLAASADITLKDSPPDHPPIRHRRRTSSADSSDFADSDAAAGPFVASASSPAAHPRHHILTAVDRAAAAPVGYKRHAMRMFGTRGGSPSSRARRDDNVGAGGGMGASWGGSAAAPMTKKPSDDMVPPPRSGSKNRVAWQDEAWLEAKGEGEGEGKEEGVGDEEEDISGAATGVMGWAAAPSEKGVVGLDGRMLFSLGLSEDSHALAAQLG